MRSIIAPVLKLLISACEPVRIIVSKAHIEGVDFIVIATLRTSWPRLGLEVLVRFVSFELLACLSGTL